MFKDIPDNDPLLAIPNEAEIVSSIAALKDDGNWHKVGEYSGIPIHAYRCENLFGVVFVRGRYDGIQGHDGKTAQEAFNNAFQALAKSISEGR